MSALDKDFTSGSGRGLGAVGGRNAGLGAKAIELGDRESHLAVEVVVATVVGIADRAEGKGAGGRFGEADRLEVVGDAILVGSARSGVAGTHTDRKTEVFDAGGSGEVLTRIGEIAEGRIDGLADPVRVGAG